MASIGTLFNEKLARLIGERTARTQVRRANDIAERDTSDRPSLHKTGLSALT
jgi:hypothetical protein